MYTPKNFVQSDQEKVRELIARYSFVTVLSYPQGEPPFINHLPIIFAEGSDDILLGHMAKANPQWKHFKDNPNCTMIVNGPHTFVSPRWYTSGRDVPTWNYAVAHLYGKIELIEGYKEQLYILEKLSNYYDPEWDFSLPEDLLGEKKLTGAIVSFQFKIEKIDAKFKMSQNRPYEDRMGVIEGLSERIDDMSAAVQEMMLEYENELAGD